MVKKSDDKFIRFDTTPACDGQTDRQTDGRTSCQCDSIFRAVHTHRAVRKVSVSWLRRVLLLRWTQLYNFWVKISDTAQNDDRQLIRDRSKHDWPSSVIIGMSLPDTTPRRVEDFAPCCVKPGGSNADNTNTTPIDTWLSWISVAWADRYLKRSTNENKNLAIGSRSRVSCADNSSRASPWLWNLR